MTAETERTGRKRVEAAIAPLTSEDSPQQNAERLKPGRGFGSTLLRPRGINLLTIGVGVIVLMICGVLLYSGYSSLRNDQVAAIEREAHSNLIIAIRGQYDGDVRLHDKIVADYNLCLNSTAVRVETRGNIRDVLFDYAEGIGETVQKIIPDVPQAALFAMTFATDREKFVDEKYPPLDLATEQAKCVVPGPEPVVPPELQ